MRIMWFAKACLGIMFLLTQKLIYAQGDANMSACMKEAVKKGGPIWYSKMYCACAVREATTANSIEYVVTTCRKQQKEFLNTLAKTCALKVGRDSQKIKECMNNFNQPTTGSMAVIDKGVVGKTVYYDVISHDFKANLFSQSDIVDYSSRVEQRNCTDPDIRKGFASGIVFHYDMYGSDKIKIGTFEHSEQTCKQKDLKGSINDMEAQRLTELKRNETRSGQALTKANQSTTVAPLKQADQTHRRKSSNDKRHCLNLKSIEAISRCAAW